MACLQNPQQEQKISHSSKQSAVLSHLLTRNFIAATGPLIISTSAVIALLYPVALLVKHLTSFRTRNCILNTQILDYVCYFR